MAEIIYPPVDRKQHGMTPATRRWRRDHAYGADWLHKKRQDSSHADTSLIIPAAQHPLVEGVRPGPEFEHRLQEGLAQYRKTVDSGGRAKFFLTGNRHHDAASGQTDRVALHDASGLWLLDNGVPAGDLHGKDWTDRYKELIYNGADEIRVAFLGFLHNPRFRGATYICSPGQTSRAKMYALAHGFPLDVRVAEAVQDSNQEQFHTPNLTLLALNGLTQTVDPYGDILAKRVADRIPADGEVGTLPNLLPDYAGLPWYSADGQ